MIYNVAIIGGGCAGLTAAIYCGRALLNPIIFTDSSEYKGGSLVKTSIIENYPGFPDGINGYELISNFEKQAIKYTTNVIKKKIIKVDFLKKPFTLTDSQGIIYQANSIIICTGSYPRKLNLI